MGGFGGSRLSAQPVRAGGHCAGHGRPRYFVFQAQPGLLGIALSLAGEAVPLQAWLVRPKEYTAWCPCGKFWAPGRPAGPRFKAIAVQAQELVGSLDEKSGRVQAAVDGSSYRSRRGFGPSTARARGFHLCRVCQAAVESSRFRRHLGPQSGIASIGG